jgi:hypothetical protein
LVVPGGVEGELAEELAGGGVDDPDGQVLDEDQDAGSGVGPADADVVQPAAGGQGDGPGGVDAVGPDAVVGVAGPVAGRGLRPGLAGGRWSGPAGQGLVRAALVVLVRESIQQLLELGDGDRLGGLCAEPFLEGLLESLDLAPGLRVVRLPVLLPDAQPAQLVLQGVAAASRCLALPRPGLPPSRAGR